MTSFGDDVARSVIEALASKYDFDVDEALAAFKVDARCVEKRSRATRVSSPSSRGSTRSSAPPPMLPVPFCGKSVDGWCSGIRPNGGLYTQCSNEPDGDFPYCVTCRRQVTKNENGLPNGGDIGERIAKGIDWRSPKGIAPMRVANVLNKSKKVITDELRSAITDAAGLFGWTVPDDEWIVKPASRGRPRKTKSAVVDTTATEDEGNNSSSPGKKTYRKFKSVSDSELENAVDTSDGEELVLSTPSMSTLVNRRSNNAPSVSVVTDENTISPIQHEASNSISPIVQNEAPKPKKARKQKMSAEEKEATKAANAEEKRLKKEAVKAEKLAEKEAAKAAKAEEKLAEKEAAKAAKAEEKQVEKEATKAAKAEEKQVEKEAAEAAKAEEKLAEKEAAEAANVADPEVYEEETDNSDDEASDVAEFVHKGKKYLRDPKTNDIFDFNVFMESGEAQEIGVFNPCSGNIEFHDE